MNWIQQLHQVQATLRLMAMESDRKAENFFNTGNQHMAEFLGNQASIMEAMDECICEAINSKLDQELVCDAISRQDPRSKGFLKLVKGGKK